MNLLDNIRHVDLRVNPKVLILFGPQKIGKTHALTKLKNNLILDFDKEGTDYYKCNRVKIKDFNTYVELLNELSAKKPMFKYLTIDTLTTFYEDFINALAVIDYNEDNGKKKPLDFDINKLDYGKGHYYKREALKKQIDFLEGYCETLIIVGHVADRAVNSDGPLGVSELDIEGKLKSILASRISAIGYFYRDSKDNTENILSFKNSGDIISGSRAGHLANNEFIISKKVDSPEEPNGYTIETYWDKIFIK